MSLALDVAIGLAFLYLLLALIVTTTQELVATFANWRAKDSYSAIESMLFEDDGKGKPQIVQAVFEHPLIRNLRQNPKCNEPSGGLGGGFWFNLLGPFLQLRGIGPRVSPKTGESEGTGA